MEGTKKYDVIVVGSGAAGGWAAKELTERGMQVLLLEAGPPAQAPLPDITAQPVQSICYLHAPETSHLFVDDAHNPYSTPEGMPFVWLRGRIVGGRTLIWAGQSYRFSDHEFKAASFDGFGQDWPISYADLAPYYDLVERVANVSGSNDGIPNLPDGCFLAAMPLSNGEVHLKSAIGRKWQDRHVIPARRALYKNPSMPGPDRNTVHKYFTSPSSTLRAALQTERLTIQTNAVVSHVIADPPGKVAEGVAFIDRVTRRASEAFASVVVLCASTIETTRILLNSRSPRHPDGIANSSGLLGQHLMDHLVLSFDGVIHHPGAAGLDTPEHETSNGIYIPRFQNLTSRDRRFLRGYAIQAKTTASYRSSDSRTGSSQLSLEAFGEMLPRRDNRVTLDPSMCDAWGIPAARIECAHSANDLAMMSAAGEVIAEIASVANIEWLNASPAVCKPGMAAHEVGTARMGADPRSSVLNPFNQSWDVKNLFVTDGACFPSQGSQSPTLTIMALTARTCAYIAEQWRCGHL
jgi:choline dehydrogenase-like flavoprotein